MNPLTRPVRLMEALRETSALTQAAPLIYHTCRRASQDEIRRRGQAIAQPGTVEAESPQRQRIYENVIKEVRIKGHRQAYFAAIAKSARVGALLASADAAPPA